LARALSRPPAPPTVLSQISATVQPGGEHTDNFYHEVSHLNVEVGNNPGTFGFHWAVAQATAIRDVYINATGSKGGLFCENGGGGFLGDIVVEGGETGLSIGGQQWTLRNITISDSTTACMDLIWNWAFAVIAPTFRRCPVGVSFQGGAVTSVVLTDATFEDVGTGVATDWPGTVRGVVLERVTATRTPVIAPGLPGSAVGTATVRAWRQGHRYAGSKPSPDFNGQGDVTPWRADVPLPNRPRPTFDSAGAPFNAVTDGGCKGDGVADDTACLQRALNSSSALVFLPAGTYRLTDTVAVRPGTALVGEALSTLAVDGSAAPFRDASSPVPAIRVLPGAPVTLADLTITVMSDAPGAQLIEWAAGNGSAVYDVHFRLYHAAYGQWHFLPGSSGYVENSWGWTADHDIDSGAELQVQVPRGWLVQGSGVQLYGTAVEHNSAYNYNFSGADDVITAMMQTETPYWQQPQTAWGLTVEGGTSGLVSYGSGFYSWFFGGQAAVARVDGSTRGVTLLCHNVVGSAELLVSGGGGSISNSSSAAGTFSAYLAMDTQAGGA